MKKRLVAASLLAALFVFTAVTLSGCAAKGSWQGFSGRYFFHTTADLRLFAGAENVPSVEEAQRVSNDVEAILRDLENSLSVTQSSPVTDFNDAAPGETVELDEASYEVFTLAKTLYEETGGCYDPSVYHSVEAYGFYNFQAGGPAPESLPSEKQLAAFRALSEYFPQVELFEENGSYYATKPEGASVTVEGVEYVLKVDFGGIAKGYACDRVKELCAGFEYGYFSFSGSSMAVGKYTEEREYYELSAAAPRGGVDYLTAQVQDTCLSTSADNGLFYEIDGTRYTQIIDPETMMPVNVLNGKNTAGIVTATVLGESAARCDALTTALMAMGTERALEFVKTLDETVWFVELNGERMTVYTNAPAGSYTVAGGYDVVELQ